MSETRSTSVKRNLIDRNNSRMLAVVAIAGVLLSFTVVASISMSRRMAYQSKVISARDKADKQLKANIKSVNTLVASYKTFDETSESVVGTADRNSKVILDALPSKYDFPALATSLQVLLQSNGLSNISINGVDDEATAEQSSSNPKPIEIPFTVSARGNYDNIKKLVDAFHRSIRPFYITRLDFSGNQAEMNVTVTGKTYYQPSKNLDIPLKEVK